MPASQWSSWPPIPARSVTCPPARPTAPSKPFPSNKGPPMKKFLSFSVAAIAGAVCIALNPAHAADTDVEIHGFVSQGYIKTTEENEYPVGNSGQGSFNFNDFGINFTKRLAPDLRVGLQLFAQDRGNFGNDTITLDWAYGDYRYQDWLGVRVGKVKIPLGLYN